MRLHRFEQISSFTFHIQKAQYEYSYRSAVLHHGVLHLMTLGNTTREEAALANVIVEMFQTPISVERQAMEGRKKRTKG